MIKTVLKGVVLAGGTVVTMLFTMAAVTTGSNITSGLLQKIDGKKVEKKKD
jgi:hypothetical protein